MTAPEQLDALAARLRKLGHDMDRHATYDWDEHEDVYAAADAITALRAELADMKAVSGRWMDRAEAAEAQRQAADDALVDKYRKPGSGVFNFPGDVAAIVMRLDAAEAEVARLTEELEEMRDYYLRKGGAA